MTITRIQYRDKIILCIYIYERVYELLLVVCIAYQRDHNIIFAYTYLVLYARSMHTVYIHTYINRMVTHKRGELNRIGFFWVPLYHTVCVLASNHLT